MIQLTLTLKMTTAQVVEFQSQSTSVLFRSVHPDDHTQCPYIKLLLFLASAHILSIFFLYPPAMRS